MAATAAVVEVVAPEEEEVEDSVDLLEEEEEDWDGTAKEIEMDVNDSLNGMKSDEAASSEVEMTFTVDVR